MTSNSMSCEACSHLSWESGVTTQAPGGHTALAWPSGERLTPGPTPLGPRPALTEDPHSTPRLRVKMARVPQLGRGVPCCLGPVSPVTSSLPTPFHTWPWPLSLSCRLSMPLPWPMPCHHHPHPTPPPRPALHSRPQRQLPAGTLLALEPLHPTWPRAGAPGTAGSPEAPSPALYINLHCQWRYSNKQVGD